MKTALRRNSQSVSTTAEAQVLPAANSCITYHGGCVTGSSPQNRQRAPRASRRLSPRKPRLLRSPRLQVAHQRKKRGKRQNPWKSFQLGARKRAGRRSLSRLRGASGNPCQTIPFHRAQGADASRAWNATSGVRRASAGFLLSAPISSFEELT